MATGLEFLPLLLLLFLAFIVPPLLSKFRWLPVVVGEIVVGMIVGRSGLNIVRTDDTLSFLAEIGLAILMFLSGLEIDFSLLTRPAPGGKSRANPSLLAGTSFVLTVGLAGLLSWQLVARGLTDDVVMVGLILSTTSLGVVLPVLKERRLSAGAFGQTILLAALLADFITMLLITVYVTLRAKGLNLDILLVALLFVAALIAFRVGRAVLRKSAADRVFDDILPVSSKTRLHGSMALLLAFVILAGLLGSEMILGAFLAGVVLSLLSGPYQTQLKGDLDAIGFGFFIPVFFLMVGVEFDLPALVRSPRTWVLAPLLLVGAYVIKVLPALVFRFGFTWKQTLAGGLLLSSRLSLIIAASEIGLRLGAIDEPTNAAFILVAAVTATASPILFNSLTAAGTASARSAVAVVGATDLALQTARELTALKEKVHFIDIAGAPAEAARAAGFAILGAPAPSDGLGGVKFPPLKSLLALTPEDDVNLTVCREARALGIRHVVVFVNDCTRLSEFAALGVQPFAPGLYRATLLAFMARHPDLFGVMTSSRADHQVREILVLSRSMSGRPLKDLALGGDLLVLSVRRGDESLVPHGDTKLLEGDWVTVYGDGGPIDALQTRLESLA
ncbi:MAG: cation:proton antiporter [Candidatus Aminicenantes bacterium]|nr:cation:proton antiporter [Candidatus Aminicenantes bacterium]